MARGRTRVGAYGRSQTQKGIDTSKSFGGGFSKLFGGVADIVKGVASAGSQAAGAAERSFTRPNVKPVTTSAPGSMSGAPVSAPAPVATTRNPAGPPMPAATTTATTAPARAPATVPLPPRRGDGNPVTKVPVASTTASATATGDTYSGGRNKAAFDTAFNKAREIGGASAKFKFDGKDYQAAKTKDEYVPSSKQNTVDIGDLSKNVAPAKPAAATTDNTPSNAQTQTTPNATSASTPKPDDENKAKGSVKPMHECVQVGSNKYRIV